MNVLVNMPLATLYKETRVLCFESTPLKHLILVYLTIRENIFKTRDSLKRNDLISCVYYFINCHFQNIFSFEERVVNLWSFAAPLCPSNTLLGNVTFF